MVALWMSVLVCPLICSCVVPVNATFKDPLVDARLFASPPYCAVTTHVPGSTPPVLIWAWAVPFANAAAVETSQFPKLKLINPVGGEDAADCTVAVRVSVEP